MILFLHVPGGICTCMTDGSAQYPAKKLVLNLVKEAEQPIPANVLVRLAQVFGIEANNVRVTLNRLVGQGLLELTDRGVYELGPEARGLARQQSHWRSLEDELIPWDGRWLAIYVAHLGRRDRTQLRQRERVTEMWGFRALQQGLLIRPANFRLRTEEVTEALHDLGLEREALVFTASDFQGPDPVAAGLWPVAELNNQYRELTQQMTTWLENYPDFSLEDAARECFLIGDRVLREIAFDPRLPDEMADTAARREMVETMCLFDDVGKAIWAELIAQLSRN